MPTPEQAPRDGEGLAACERALDGEFVGHYHKPGYPCVIGLRHAAAKRCEHAAFVIVSVEH